MPPPVTDWQVLPVGHVDVVPPGVQVAMHQWLVPAVLPTAQDVATPPTALQLVSLCPVHVCKQRLVPLALTQSSPETQFPVACVPQDW